MLKELEIDVDILFKILKVQLFACFDQIPTINVLIDRAYKNLKKMMFNY
jgi:hypothetical protein